MVGTFGYMPPEQLLGQAGPTSDLYALGATLLHALGLDHTRLTVRFDGRDMRLTDVFGHVQQDWLA